MTHGSGGSWAFVDLPDRLTRDRRHKPGASSNSRRTSSQGFESCPLRCTTTFSSLLSFLGTIGEQCCAQVDSSDAPLVIPAGRRVLPLPAFVASELKKNSVDLKERRLAHPELGFDSPLVCQQAAVATLRVGRGLLGASALVGRNRAVAARNRAPHRSRQTGAPLRTSSLSTTKWRQQGRVRALTGDSHPQTVDATIGSAQGRAVARPGPPPRQRQPQR